MMTLSPEISLYLGVKRKIVSTSGTYQNYFWSLFYTQRGVRRGESRIMSGSSALRDPLFVGKGFKTSVHGNIKVNISLSKNVTNLGIFG